MFGNSTNPSSVPQQNTQDPKPQASPDAVLKDMFSALTLEKLTQPQEEHLPKAVSFSDTVAKESQQQKSGIRLDSSDILVGGQPLERRKISLSNITVDQNNKNPTQAFKDAQSTIQNYPHGDEGLIFLQDVAKSLSGYLARVLQSNTTISGSSGAVYTCADLATDILVYLDKENYQGKKRDIHITNNIFYLQSNVLLLEKVKQRLIKEDKSKEWQQIFSDLQGVLAV